MNNLFQNPGKKIKSLSIILFCINCILSLFGAFVLGRVSSVSHYGNGVIVLITFLLVLIGGLLVAFVLSLFLYGFGELIENSAKSDATKRAEELQAAQLKTASPQPQTDADPASCPQTGTEIQQQPLGEGTITQEESEAGKKANPASLSAEE